MDAGWLHGGVLQIIALPQPAKLHPLHCRLHFTLPCSAGTEPRVHITLGRMKSRIPKCIHGAARFPGSGPFPSCPSPPPPGAQTVSLQVHGVHAAMGAGLPMPLVVAACMRCHRMHLDVRPMPL